MTPFSSRPSRLPPTALERFEQRGLLATDVCAGAAMQHEGHVAQEIGAARVVERTAQDLELREVLAANVDEHIARLDRVRRDQTPFEQ